MQTFSVAVIIPVINELPFVELAIDRAWLAGADEVIVVDGGSHDGTRQFLQSAKCITIDAPPGRAIQQNHGARLSTSDVVLFLHADNWMGPGSVAQIRQALMEPGVGWGAFRQRIENSETIYRWIESGNSLRTRWLGLTYGDQGMFFRLSLFNESGGVPEVPLMEDFLLSRKLRRTHRPVLLNGPLFVSPRRWMRRGPIRQTLLNWRILIGFYMGLPLDSLARLYRRHDAP
jgi:rSAM/selenodomain-associated transferase 2